MVGRRGGKDSIASVIAAHSAALFNQRDSLQPGERTVVICLASETKRNRNELHEGLFFDVAFLKGMVQRETTTGFELSNNVDGRASVSQSFEPAQYLIDTLGQISEQFDRRVHRLRSGSQNSCRPFIISGGQVARPQPSRPNSSVWCRRSRSNATAESLRSRSCSDRTVVTAERLALPEPASLHADGETSRKKLHGRGAAATRTRHGTETPPGLPGTANTFG